MRNDIVEILNANRSDYGKQNDFMEKEGFDEKSESLSSVELSGLKENEWQMEYRLIYNSYKIDCAEA